MPPRLFLSRAKGPQRGCAHEHELCEAHARRRRIGLGQDNAHVRARAADCASRPLGGCAQVRARLPRPDVPPTHGRCPDGQPRPVLLRRVTRALPDRARRRGLRHSGARGRHGLLRRHPGRGGAREQLRRGARHLHAVRPGARRPWRLGLARGTGEGVCNVSHPLTGGGRHPEPLHEGGLRCARPHDRGRVRRGLRGLRALRRALCPREPPPGARRRR